MTNEDVQAIKAHIAQGAVLGVSLWRAGMYLESTATFEMVQSMWNATRRHLSLDVAEQYVQTVSPLLAEDIAFRAMMDAIADKEESEGLSDEAKTAVMAAIVRAGTPLKQGGKQALQ